MLLRSRSWVALGLAVAGASLLGAGCRSSEPAAPPNTDATPTFPLSCGPNRTTLGYRDPATQVCVATPPPGREAAFSGFDLLYSYATTSPTAVTVAVVGFDANVTTRRALELVSSIPSAADATLSLRLPSLRSGTSLPLELSAAERSTLDGVQAALDATVTFRDYTPAELGELHRAVAGVVVRASMRDLLAFWTANPVVVRTFRFDLPPSN